MRAVYSTVKRPVKNHSACMKRVPYTICHDSTLSRMTISTLKTMLQSNTSSKSLPARVSDSNMTLWSFPRQPPSGPCASCCIPLEDPVIPDMIADASGNAHILDDHRLRGPVTLIGGTPLYRHHYLEPRDDFGLRVATLDHEAFDDAMELRPVVKTFPRQFHEIRHRLRRVLFHKLDCYVPLVCVQCGIHSSQF